MTPATHAPAVELLAAILADQPRLTDAACRQYVELFNRAADGDREAAQEAVVVCQTCPVLTECREWAERTYPRRKPGGVLAATYSPPPTSRKKKTA